MLFINRKHEAEPGTDLSEMSRPVYGRPAVKGVLDGEVSRACGAL